MNWVGFVVTTGSPVRGAKLIELREELRVVRDDIAYLLNHCESMPGAIYLKSDELSRCEADIHTAFDSYEKAELEAQVTALRLELFNLRQDLLGYSASLRYKQVEYALLREERFRLLFPSLAPIRSTLAASLEQKGIFMRIFQG